MAGENALLEAFAFQPLALKLTGPPNCLRRFAGSSFGRFLIVPAELHLAEDSFPLHLLFERFERLIDIVVTDENLHLAAFSFCMRIPAHRGNTNLPHPGCPGAGPGL